MGKHLTPLQKEFLIHQYKGNPGIKLSDFCEANSISDGAFKKWLKQYEEQGLDGLARADAEIGSVLPEGMNPTEEAAAAGNGIIIKSSRRAGRFPTAD